MVEDMGHVLIGGEGPVIRGIVVVYFLFVLRGEYMVKLPVAKLDEDIVGAPEMGIEGRTGAWRLL